MKLALPVLVAVFLLVPAAAEAATLRAGRCAPAVERLQSSLAGLGFSPGGVDGCFGSRTRSAVQAFQKAAGLRPDGIVGPVTARALRTPRPLRPRYRGAGFHAEVDLARQLLLLVRNGRTESVYSVSTGRSGFETPTGGFRVFRRELRSWSRPYRVWLPYASYFKGGVAFHAGAVPAFPVSHGCVHVPAAFAARIYAALDVGTAVYVYKGRS